MGITKFIYLKADIGDEVVFRHPKRRGRLKGFIEEVTFSFKAKAHTYRIQTRTKQGKVCFLETNKEGIINVIGSRDTQT